MSVSAIAGQERIRVSCLASARIRHPDDPDKYALIGNRNYQSQLGVQKYTPVGGKMTIQPGKRGVLPDGVVFESKHGSDDLRLSLPVKHLGSFLDWYLRRDGTEREIDVLREAVDELGPLENGPLTLGELEGATSAFAGFKLQIMSSLKPDVAEKDRRTVYLNEVHDVVLPRGIEVLVKAALRSDSNVIFASRSEIKQQASNEVQARLGMTCLALLHPEPTLTLPQLTPIC